MTSPSPNPHIPHFHLLFMEQRFSDAFEAARVRHKLPEGSVSITTHACALSQLPAAVQFDTIVSPANSYGRLDGAFDDAISRALSPPGDYLALTHAAQAELYRKWRGFAPPGSCTLVRFPAEEFAARGNTKNVWGVKRVALCPTMRTPANVCWDREVVYECVWSLLCAIDNHNRGLAGDSKEGKKEGGREDDIRSVLMTPLATGVGRVSPERWASQAVLALKHFVEASENPDKWSKLDWEDFGKSVAEVEFTWKREDMQR
ncbi:hypothetical protein BX600DRAFT_439481 [Xylariales sp. PMI_506]|nr:hypothetical protein BX600DRAFT_439481 [Xylariales sp. PMI_506]